MWKWQSFCPYRVEWILFCLDEVNFSFFFLFFWSRYIGKSNSIIYSIELNFVSSSYRIVAKQHWHSQWKSFTRSRGNAHLASHPHLFEVLSCMASVSLLIPFYWPSLLLVYDTLGYNSIGWSYNRFSHYWWTVLM